MKTVEQHNREQREKREAKEKAAKGTGVACPACGQELKWVNDYGFGIATTYPPPTTSQARCQCGVTVELER